MRLSLIKLSGKSMVLLVLMGILIANCGNRVSVEPAPSRITVSGRQILVDGSPFTIKGVGYSPTPIGRDLGNPSLTYDFFADPEIRARDFPLLRQMGCNSIRTWGKVTSRGFLREADRYDIYVIMGFWVDSRDFSNSDVRDSLITEFRKYVNQFKDEPAVLMWSIGNEQNYDWMHQGNVKDWYTLVNEMAGAAHETEGENRHPVTTPNGEIINIGDRELGTDDSSLCYLDVWGANVYRGCSFSSLFSEYGPKSSKPFWISEYGANALNPHSGGIDEENQASCLLNLWSEISSSRDVCSGGVIMEYCDEWWKGGNPEDHDMHPEEWWGLLYVTQVQPGHPDVLAPRRVYYDLGCVWKRQTRTLGWPARKSSLYCENLPTCDMAYPAEQIRRYSSIDLSAS